jgi:hypothetical protein
VQDLLLLDVTPLSRGMGHSRGRVAVGYQGTESMLATKKKLWRTKCFNCRKKGHLGKDCNLPPTWPPTKKAYMAPTWTPQRDEGLGFHNMPL